MSLRICPHPQRGFDTDSRLWVLTTSMQARQLYQMYHVVGGVDSAGGRACVHREYGKCSETSLKCAMNLKLIFQN